MSDDTQVKEQFSLHHSYSMIPNVIFELGLDQYAFRLYCQYKKIAGDGGECWVSAPNLAIQCMMSESKLREAKIVLASKFDKLGGLPLIEITKRRDEKGNHKSDVITIVDIWVENIKICKSKKQDTGTQKNPPLGVLATHPGSQKTGHYVEQEPLNKKTTTTHEGRSAPVVVFSCLEELELRKEVKERLSLENSQERSVELVKRVKAWKGRESDDKAVVVILQRWDTWSDTVTQADKEQQEQNKKVAEMNERDKMRLYAQSMNNNRESPLPWRPGKDFLEVEIKGKKHMTPWTDLDAAKIKALYDMMGVKL